MIAMFLQDSHQIRLFDHLQKDELELLNSVMEVCFYESGEHVFEQGKVADFLYILYSGKVTVIYKPYDGPPLTVAAILPGNVFGWSSVLGRRVYSSSALVQEDCKCYRIGKRRLAELYNKNQKFGNRLLKRLAGAVNQQANTYDEVYALLKRGVEGGK